MVKNLLCNVVEQLFRKRKHHILRKTPQKNPAAIRITVPVPKNYSSGITKNSKSLPSVNTLPVIMTA